MIYDIRGLIEGTKKQEISFTKNRLYFLKDGQSYDF
jgi:hypothetical protein